MNYYIFAPSITITAFVDFIFIYITIWENKLKCTGKGIVASVSSVLQSAGACRTSAKKEAHRTVAEQYNNLIIGVKFEIETK